jgi:hypothetical protein
VGLLCLVLGGGVLARQARASEDVVQFGNKIEVGKNDTVQDAVCFFCSIDVDGTVNGDVVAFFGSVRINGHANHDVVNFFGNVSAADNSSIGDDLVNFFGGVRLGENVDVGKDTVVMFGSLRAASTVSFGGDRVVQPGWIFWVPLLAIGLGISFLVQEVRGRRQRRFLRGY